MSPFDSPSGPSSQPLHDALSSMTLNGRSRQSTGGGGGGLLQDEDLSLALDMHGVGGDDSFDLLSSQGPPTGGAFGEGEDETIRFGAGPSSLSAKTSGGAQDKATTRSTAAEEEFVYGGSMAPQAVPASKQFDPFSSTLPTTASSSSSATSPPPPTSTSSATGPSASRPAGADDDYEEDDEVDMEAFSEEDQARIKALRFERDSLRGMNRTLEGLRGALGRMEGKVATFASSISTTHSLLDLYSRIASQAEHTKELLLDGEWRGVEADYDLLSTRQAAAAAAEEARMQQEQEERERRERERREAEEAAVRRAQEAARAAEGGAATRGRGRGVLRGSTLSSRGRVSSTLSSTSSSRGRGGLSSTSSSIPSPTTRSNTSTSTSASSSFSSGIPTASTRGSAPVSGVRGVRGLRSRVATAGARGGRGRGAAA